MFKIRINFFVTICLAILFISCNNKDLEKSEEVFAASEDLPAINYKFGLPLNSDIDNYRWGNLTGKEREEAREESFKRMSEALSIASPLQEKLENENGLDITEFIEDARQRFQENSDKSGLFLAEQMLAMSIQKRLFPEFNFDVPIYEINVPEFNNQELRLLQYALELNVKNGNPNADLNSFNILLLADSGSSKKEKLNQLASNSIDNALAWYGERKVCINCTNKIKQPELKLQLVQKGIDDLQKFIDSN